MFLLVSLITTVIVLGVALLKRNKQFTLLLFVMLSLDIFLLAIFTFIVKKGGIPSYLVNFLYLNMHIRNTLLHFVITFNQLGYCLSIGRFLFPYLMLFFASSITGLQIFQQKKILFLFSIPPTLSLIFYVPYIFKTLSLGFEQIIMWASLVWVILYLLLAFILLILDIFIIKPGLYQLKYFAINLFCEFLIIVFFMYVTQDAAVIYSFYAYNLPWTFGLSYANILISQRLSLLLLTLYVILAAVGILSFYFYITEVFKMNREEIALKNKDKTAVPATYIFVHGIKNRLLVQQVYMKKIQRKLELTPDTAEDLMQLVQENESLLDHLNELYKIFKSDQVILQKRKISEIVLNASRIFKAKYPQAPNILLNLPQDQYIMADFNFLSEAFANLLINGYEAMEEKPVADRKMEIQIKNGFFYIVLSFIDKGKGIEIQDRRGIFDPFMSNKNSSYNWGMGLYFTKKIIKQHSGRIFFENNQGEGTTMKVLLPKKGMGKQK